MYWKTVRVSPFPLIPRGFHPRQDDKGEKGDKSDKGEKGEKGDKGDKGDKGEKGEAILRRLRLVHLL
jgi:hypothetical protein